MTLVVGCASANRGEGDLASVDAEVRTFLATFTRLGVAAQWDSLATLYDDSPAFTFIERGKIVATSRAEIRRGFDKVPPGMALDTQFDSLEISPIGARAALVNTRSRTTFVDRSKGNAPAFGFTTRLTMVLVRTAEGWKIRQGHASSGG